MESSVNSTRPIKVAIVAGEESGDILGAGLISSLKKRYPNATFEGVGGRRMIAKGLDSEFPMERLSVMGLVEVLKRLRELLKRRKKLIEKWLQTPPDLFIGIDAPDFNLGLERVLKERAIPTVHYVSPSVWAWREKRLKKIEQSVDLMLCFLPFEAKYYKDTQVKAQFIGHPLATQLPLSISQSQAKTALGLSDASPVLALMPGSRSSEVGKLAPPFIETALALCSKIPNLQVILPAANEARYQQIALLIREAQAESKIKLVQGSSQECLMAADSVLISSGTATLEAMLCSTPMVVAYKMAPLSYAIISRMLKTPYVSLPNLLAGRALVPEIFQSDVRVEVLEPLVLQSLTDSHYIQSLQQEFSDLSGLIRQDADEQAAEAVSTLLEFRS
ncbi:MULTISPECIES: lipid-A-disaccharide synthase [unclassified Marinobacterium]|uniref:lipid-A-disaccharide synthase n=1 Tax=Marinobacterium sp. xm-a-152 TaxID=2497733 RepID=UPI0015696CF0|nr:Lipid-A-disaccharide synthase [Marinobacterium sp. xm-a-152]NRP46916.1 Lipid-A-disaccharide synthase [Marinobacterium sp. xm-d-543]